MLKLNAKRSKKLEQNEGEDEGISRVLPEKIMGRRTKHGTEEMDDETTLKRRNHRVISFENHSGSRTTDRQSSWPKKSKLRITERETHEGPTAQRIARVNGRYGNSTRAFGSGLTKFLSPLVYWDLKGHISSHVSGALIARSTLLTTFTALLVLIFSCSFCCRYVRASEFPERECCDLVFPIPEPTGRSTSAPTPTGRSGSDIKTAVAILNCLFARQLCFEDPSCSAILEIIPRVCGPELVACSTVTVTKCQAALRTLQAFSFFRPTCLCKEPHIDPDCNSFRDFLFDHPCIYVLKKEKDPSQIEALPMCNHALTVCQRGNPCNQLYEDFKMNCKARDGKCRMENRDACHDSWTQLRLSPMFGCICPNNQINRRCDRIFSMVYHNPCVEYLPPSASVDLSGTDSALYPFDPQQESYQEIWLPPTSMYPYFLFPGTARTPYYEHESPVEAREELEHGLRRHGHRHHHGGRHQEAPELPGRPGVLVVEAYDHRDEQTYRRTRLNELDDEDDRGVGSGSTGNKVEQGERMDSRRRLWDHVDRVGLSYSSSTTTTSTSSSSLSSPSSSSTLSKHDRAYVTVHLQPQHPHQSEHDTETHLQHRHRHPAPAPPAQPAPAPPPPAASSSSPSPRLPRPTPTVDESERDDEAAGKAAAAVPPKKFAPRPTYEHRAIFDRADEDLDEREYRIAGPPVDRLFDLREALDGFVDQVKVISHPDNSTSFEVIESQLENPLIDAAQLNLHSSKQLPIPGIHRHAEHHKKNSTAEDHEQISAMEIPLQPVKLILSSTCHHAYTACRSDPECKPLLQLVLNHCELSSCARNECMGALQQFYKQANHKHSVDIAFCLCKKTEDRKDECIVAQEKMHPVCAQRTEGSDLPTCHSLAETCKENKGCRMRLEYYEQSCAVDSVTKKCAGQPSECRKAMLGILGTELRSNCACKGTDLAQMHDCLGWQRLLWVNPCVVESQKDYHARRKHHHHPRMTTTSIATTTSTTTVTSKTVVVSTPLVTTIEQVEDNQIPEVTRPATESTETSEITTTSTTTTTPSTTTSTTTPPRFCVVQRPKQSTQYIREGKGKRLYREDEPECSELCHCGEDVLVTCNAICVETSPCKSEFAFYNHEAPAYQAHRGRCLCYSGRFICMRPSPDTYSIPHGVFMFLGYSEKDETLLRHYNNLTVLDAVSSLDSFIREEVNNQTVCTLFLYNVTRENVIAVARLGTDNPPLNSSQAQSLEHLMRVKDECVSMLQDLSKKINEKHQEVHTHPLLSIFKMAEVEVKLPYSSGAGSVRTSVSSWLLLWSTLTSSILARPTLTYFIGS